MHHTALAPSVLTSDVAAAPPHESVVAALTAAAATERPFVTFHGGRAAGAFTYADVLRDAHRWAALLAARGVGPGDAVPLLMPTGPAFLGALFGTMLLGALPAPLASPMTLGGVGPYLRNLAAIVRDSGARCLVTYERIAGALGESEELRALLREVLTEKDLGSTHARPRIPSRSGSDTAFLQYTSGTTGRPKGVVVSHRALVSNAFAIAHGLGLSARDVGVSWLPLFHDMGLIGVLLTAVCHPYPLHVIAPEAFAMRPLRWLELMTEVSGTVSAAPNFAYELCASRPGETEALKLASWRAALNGSEPVLRTTADRFAARFLPHGFRPDCARPVYGLAENTLAVTFSPAGGVRSLAVDSDALAHRARAVPGAGPGVRHAVSVGTPVAGTSVAVVDRSGRPVPEGHVGEVRVAGPSLMDGYYRNPEASAASLVDGWLRTGDLGFVHGAELYIAGRARDVIIKGGRNFHAQDLERVAASVRGVRAEAVAAFGRSNEAAGTDDVVVVVETTERDEEARARMVREVRGELLAALGVRVDEVRLCRVGAVPRTTSGKIRRGECARAFAPKEAP